MLSKLFGTRQSTASRAPPSQSGPTLDQPTDPKPPSKLARKLKAFKNALRPSRLTKKADDQAGQKSRGNHKSNLSDESWGNLAPGPFTAEDYDFRRGSPISTHQELGPSLPSIEGSSGTRARSSRSSSPQSDFATSPPSTQLAPIFTTPVNASVHLQQPVSANQVESRVLAVRKVRRDNAQDVPAHRSSRALTPAPRTTSITQNRTPDVAAHQPVEEHLLPEAPVHAKTGEKQVKKQRKWWEMGGSLKDYERHLRRDAVDYGNPSYYSNLEEFGEKARSLKRGGANQRRQRPEPRHSSKKARGPKKAASENEPIPGEEKGERTPFSATTTDDAFNCHGRTLSLTSTGAAQALPSAARQPLGSLNLNVVLSGEAQVSGGVDDSSPEAGDVSSQGTEAQDATSAEVSSWLGGIVVPRRQSQGPAQN